MAGHDGKSKSKETETGPAVANRMSEMRKVTRDLKEWRALLDAKGKSDKGFAGGSRSGDEAVSSQGRRKRIRLTVKPDKASMNAAASVTDPETSEGEGKNGKGKGKAGERPTTGGKHPPGTAASKGGNGDDKANLPGYAKTGTKASEIAERIVTAAKCVNETEPCPPCAEAREPCYKSEKVSSRCARCVSKGWTKVKCSTGRKESLKVKANKNEATAGKGAKAVEKDEKVKVMVLERQKLGTNRKRKAEMPEIKSNVPLTEGLAEVTTAFSKNCVSEKDLTKILKKSEEDGEGQGLVRMLVRAVLECHSKIQNLKTAVKEQEDLVEELTAKNDQLVKEQGDLVQDLMARQDQLVEQLTSIQVNEPTRSCGRPMANT